MDIKNFFGPVGVKKGKDTGNDEKKKHLAESNRKGSRKTSTERNSRKDSGDSHKTDTKNKKRKKESTTEEEADAEEVVHKKGKPRSKKTQRIESDSDEEPIPKKNKKKKEAVVFIDDSDEETDRPKKRSSLDGFVKVTPPKPRQPSAKTPEVKTPISALDFFGSSSVQRSDRKIVAGKRKQSTERRDSSDVEMYDDDDFSKTLSQLDDEVLPKKVRWRSVD